MPAWLLLSPGPLTAAVPLLPTGSCRCCLVLLQDCWELQVAAAADCLMASLMTRCGERAACCVLLSVCHEHRRPFSGHTWQHVGLAVGVELLVTNLSNSC
jgi:hypothetical protein